jgi:hypothetical protein
MSNRSSSEQSKTVVDAYYQAGVEGCLTEFARYLHPDFTTTAPKLPKVFVSLSEPHHWKDKNLTRRKALRGRPKNSAPTPLDCNQLEAVPDDERSGAQCRQPPVREGTAQVDVGKFHGWCAQFLRTVVSLRSVDGG